MLKEKSADTWREFYTTLLQGRFYEVKRGQRAPQ